jgi:uridine phosphorylase
MPDIENLAQNNGPQTHIDMKPGDVGEYVLLPGDPARVEVFANFVDQPRIVAYQREFKTCTGFFKGIKVSCTSTGIGSSSTAIAIEELANLGAKTFIRIGSCGSLVDDVHVRDLVIVTGSLRNDGTTPFYAPLAMPAVPDFYLTQAVVQSASELRHQLDFAFHIGLSCSSAAYYMETTELLSQMRHLGLKCVEMESAVVFIVAHLRGLHAASILTVTAECFPGEAVVESKPGQVSPVPFDNMIRVALETIHKFHNQKISNR